MLCCYEIISEFFLTDSELGWKKYHPFQFGEEAGRFSFFLTELRKLKGLLTKKDIHTGT
jgi:hypothetical protein